MPRALFLTGLARGGTNLLARMLIAGGASRIAIHAFQPWFKSLRNALVAQHGSAAIRERFDPESPFGDGHFDDFQRAVLDLLHEATLDVTLPSGEWPDLLDRLRARAAHDAADLVPGLAGLAGAASYRDMLDRILGLILEGRGQDTEYVGLIDTWIVDLLPALARARPDARFLVVLRDPRAVIASTLKFMDIDPTQVSHVLSVVRQWRKYAALACEFGRRPLFAGRLLLVRYEDEVRDPERFAGRLCEFLDLRFRPSMIDFARFGDAGGIDNWRGNSAFEPSLSQIEPAAAGRWRQTLTPSALAAVEFCCGLDMVAAGYEPVNSPDRLAVDTLPLEFLIEDGRRACAWRSDSGDPEIEYGREAFRRVLARLAGGVDDRSIRRAFLSPAYFDLLRSGDRLVPAS